VFALHPPFCFWPAIVDSFGGPCPILRLRSAVCEFICRPTCNFCLLSHSGLVVEAVVANWLGVISHSDCDGSQSS